MHLFSAIPYKVFILEILKNLKLFYVYQRDFEGQISIFELFVDVTPVSPCSQNPCGPNSICRPINNQAVCTCVEGYIGRPPLCRPECTTSSECSLNQACINHKCIDPCKGACGIDAICKVVNHRPKCHCASKFSGNPYVFCSLIRKN